jgi:O-antigen biosynthesis protein
VSETIPPDTSGSVKMLRSLAETKCFGRADPVQQSKVTGWFVSSAEQPVIAALIDGYSAGQAKVALLEEPVVSAPVGARVFSFRIPRRYQDGRSHSLTLTLDDGSSIDFLGANGATLQHLRFRFEAPDNLPEEFASDQLQAVPIHLSSPCAPDSRTQVSPFVGYADPFIGTTITGWAACVAESAEPVLLAIFIDGVPVGTAVCNRPTSNRRDIGVPQSAGDFVYAIPDRFLDGTTHTVAIRFSDGSPLAFSDSEAVALRFTAEAATSIDGVVDGLVGDSIKGWAIRTHHASGEIVGQLTIQVLCNGVIVGEVAADQPRLDVARELHCDPRVGFLVRLPAECRNGQEFLFSVRVLPEGQDLAGSPISVRHQAFEGGRELRSLAVTVDQLCTSAFKLQQQVRDLLPATDATVENYDAWARNYQAQLRSRMAAAQSLPDDMPLVSVIMPTYRSNLAHLTAAIETVRGQTYTNWELIVVDDGSRSPAIVACLKSYAAAEQRIKCLFRKGNCGISATTNSGLRRARGAFVVFFDHDDLMVEVALEVMVREALRTGAKLLYSDEDKIDDFGAFSEPNFKPDWNYRLLLGVNYICHLVMVDRELLRRTGRLRSECDGAQDYDLLLRLSEKCPPAQIVHLPEVLYHWRKTAGSTADSDMAKPYAIMAGRRAISDHLARRGFMDCQVTPIGGTTNYAVSWGLRRQPSVSIIVPFKDHATMTRRCLDALLAHTDWKDWRIILVDNGSETAEAASLCREAAGSPCVTVHRIDEPFNFARLNNLAAQAYPSDYYLFINNDVVITQPDWLRVLFDEALADPTVAIVGAKLVYPDGMVQHGGVVLGVGGVADHAFKGLPADSPGYMSRARCAQQYSAVTAACMLCRADAFLDAGGFDERELAIAFNDIDLCLKVGRQGHRVIWTPMVVAEHHESLSRGDDMAPDKAARFFYENYVMFQRWHRVLEADPFYSPHFSRERGIFSDLR